jgi:hypothetical protein
MTRGKARFISVALFITIAVARAGAGDAVFRSGPAPVWLLELFTSEGCSSCPPAEKWLGALRGDPRLWRDVVPVAWHVDYWDRLGWRDRLASRAFTERQYNYAAAWRDGSVYTPCFVRGGVEWRPAEGAALTAGAARADAGVLTLAWHAADGRCEVSFVPAQSLAARTLEVSVALLGGGIVSAVRAGENRGRELRHEFVALRLATARLERAGSEVGGRAAETAAAPGAARYTAVLTLEPRPEVAASRLALAGWVTRRGELAPLQAAGGWLPAK